MRMMCNIAEPLARLYLRSSGSNRLRMPSLANDQANDKIGYVASGDPRTPVTRSGFQVASRGIDRLA